MIEFQFHKVGRPYNIIRQYPMNGVTALFLNSFSELWNDNDGIDTISMFKDCRWIGRWKKNEVWLYSPDVEFIPPYGQIYVNEQVA